MNTKPHEIIEKEKNVDLKKELKEKEENETWLQVSPLILGLASFILSLFFLTEKLTGNIIFNLEQPALNYVGSTLFITALILLIFYFWKKRHLLEK